MFDDGQAQSSATNVPSTVVIHPIKSLSQPRNMNGGDSAAMILDSDFDTLAAQ
jgi:hypothetical protein